MTAFTPTMFVKETRDLNGQFRFRVKQQPIKSLVSLTNIHFLVGVNAVNNK